MIGPTFPHDEATWPESVNNNDYGFVEPANRLQATLDLGGTGWADKEPDVLADLKFDLIFDADPHADGEVDGTLILRTRDGVYHRYRIESAFGDRFGNIARPLLSMAVWFGGIDNGKDEEL